MVLRVDAGPTRAGWSVSVHPQVRAHAFVPVYPPRVRFAPTTRVRNRVAGLADRLAPPRDQAARAWLRASLDLVAGRTPASTRSEPAVPPPAGPRPAVTIAPPSRSVPNAPIWARPGSYSSPIVDVTEVTGPGSDGSDQVDLPGIALDMTEHEQIWERWAPHVRRWTEGESRSDRRYHTDNRMFGPVSARLLAGAVATIGPRRYVEIGSGFSSAVVLDQHDEGALGHPIDCTFIEPHPDRLESILRPQDRQRCTIIVDKVQSVALEIFEQLEAGDIVFVDSTHVAKSGSDLLREIFDILPRLASGVYVHFHDIFYPFDYPRAWMVDQNRSWNEAYFVRAFLMYNEAFTVHFWTDYFALFGRDALRRTGTDRLVEGRPSSLWLVRN